MRSASWTVVVVGLGMVGCAAQRVHSRPALGNLDAAKREWREALHVSEEQTPASRQLGLAEADAGNLGSAVLEYRRALALRPHDTTTRMRLAEALFAAGRFEESLVEYRRVFSVQPDNAQVANAIGATLVAQSHDVEPPDGEGADRLKLARQQFAEGRLDGAVAEMREIVAAKPDYPRTYFELAAVLHARDARRLPPLAPSRAYAAEPGATDVRTVLVHNATRYRWAVGLRQSHGRGIDVLVRPGGTEAVALPPGPYLVHSRLLPPGQDDAFFSGSASNADRLRPGDPWASNVHPLVTAKWQEPQSKLWRVRRLLPAIPADVHPLNPDEHQVLGLVYLDAQEFHLALAETTRSVEEAHNALEVGAEHAERHYLRGLALRGLVDAALPPMSAEAIGPHEVRVRNTMGSAAVVGLRGRNGLGKNVSLRANESKSVFVPAGVYAVYWLRLSDENVQRGASIAVPPLAEITLSDATLEDAYSNLIARETEND